MPCDRRDARIPVPKNWHRHVRSAVLHVIPLAQFSAAHTPGWAVNTINTRIRFRPKLIGSNRKSRCRGRRLGTY